MPLPMSCNVVCKLQCMFMTLMEIIVP
jgi:hypothetical protein